MLTGKGEREDKERTLSSIFLIPSFNAALFFVFFPQPGSVGVMINTTTHGKRMTNTMEAVVVVGRIADRPAQASQALPGIHEGEKKKWLLNHYINGITEKLPAPRKQIKLATVLRPANREVLY